MAKAESNEKQELAATFLHQRHNKYLPNFSHENLGYRWPYGEVEPFWAKRSFSKHDPFNQPRDPIPTLDKEAILLQVDSRSEARTRGDLKFLLPRFGIAPKQDLMMDSGDMAKYAATLGQFRDGTYQDRLVGHPIDVFFRLTSGSSWTPQDVPWHNPVAKDRITNKYLLEVVSKHTSTQQREPYACVFNIINPSNNYYSEPPNNYHVAWSWMARDGKCLPQSLRGRPDDLTDFFYTDLNSNRDVYYAKMPNGHTYLRERPPVFESENSTIRMAMPVIITGSSIADAMDRLVLTSGRSVEEESKSLHFVVPLAKD